MTNQSNTSTIVSSVTLTIMSVLIAGTSLLAVQEWKSTIQVNQKNTAVQGCYEIAKVIAKTSGESKDSAWEVQDVKINQEVLANCLEKKDL